MEQLLQPLTEMGEVVREMKPAPEIRRYVMEQVRGAGA